MLISEQVNAAAIAVGVSSDAREAGDTVDACARGAWYAGHCATTNTAMRRACHDVDAHPTTVGEARVACDQWTAVEAHHHGVGNRRHGSATCATIAWIKGNVHLAAVAGLSITIRLVGAAWLRGGACWRGIAASGDGGAAARSKRIETGAGRVIDASHSQIIRRANSHRARA